MSPDNWVPGVHTLEDCADRCLQYNLGGHDKPCKAFVLGDWCDPKCCYLKDTDSEAILADGKGSTAGPISTCWHKTYQCVAKEGKHCKFPFIYKGITYDKCTKIEHSRFWCSTNTNSNNEYIGGNANWGDCTKDCPSKLTEGLRLGLQPP